MTKIEENHRSNQTGEIWWIDDQEQHAATGLTSRVSHASDRRVDWNHESRTSILQTLLLNSLSRLRYSPVNWEDLLLGMSLTLPKGPHDNCPNTWPHRRDSARRLATDLSARLETAFSRRSERSNAVDSTTRSSGPTARPNRRKGPLGQDELGKWTTAYKRRKRGNEEGIRKSRHTYFRLETRVSFPYSRRLVPSGEPAFAGLFPFHFPLL